MSCKVELRYGEGKPPRWVEAHRGDVEKNGDGTANVFSWGYVFRGCEVRSAPSDRSEPETEYVLVTHPTGNRLRVWWPVWFS